MAGMPAIPETAAAEAARRALLAAIVDLWGADVRFAAAMGVSKGTVSRWQSGALPFGWPVLFSALKLAAKLYPDKLPRILALLGGEIGFPCRVEPLDSDGSDDGDYLTEVAEDERNDAEMTEAVIRGDTEAVRTIGERALENTRARTNAALREIERRQAPTLRAVGGGR